jgi:light-regulated signal transduction histidine kinase (bacteriophytochrome)
VEQCQDLLHQTRQQVELVAGLISGLRAWLEAEDPGDVRRVVDFGQSLAAVIADLEGVAEAQGVKIQGRAQPRLPVVAEPRRLRQALFHLLEYALQCAGREVQVEARAAGREAVLVLATSPMENPSGPSTRAQAGEDMDIVSRRLRLATVRRMIEAAGGWIHTEISTPPLAVELRMPLAGN